MQYDVIIVGMGISGISAAIYAKNGGLNVLMLEKESPGGLTNKINVINNYPGFSTITGPDLAFNLYETIQKLDIPYKKQEVKNITIENGIKTIETDKETFTCKNIIIASGRKNRLLGLPNEQELIGKGISTCALCDAHFYEKKDIAIVGGGNSAIEEAIYLSKFVNKIYMIHRREEFTAEQELINNLEKCSNVEYIWNSQVTEILTKDGFVSGVKINDKEELSVSGLFIYIGFVSNTDFIKELNITDEFGNIKVDKKQETSIKGIYAVGDCTKKQVYQLITAASEGTIAAVNIIRELEK